MSNAGVALLTAFFLQMSSPDSRYSPLADDAFNSSANVLCMHHAHWQSTPLTRTAGDPAKSNAVLR